MDRMNDSQNKMEETVALPNRKKNLVFRNVLRFVLWFFSISLLLILILVGLVFIYEDAVKKSIIGELNTHLRAKVLVKPENIDLSILSTFPEASLDFKEVICFDTLDTKTNDTLFSFEKIGLQFNLIDLWNQNYCIKTLKVQGGKLKMRVDKKGNVNYLIWKESSDTNDSKSVDFKINKVIVEKIYYSFRSKKDGIKIDTYFDNATIKGNFYSEKFNLLTEASFKLHQLYSSKRVWLADKNITCKVEIDVEKGKYQFKNVALKINEMQLMVLGSLIKSERSLFANLTFDGNELDIKSTLSLLPQSQQDRIADYESDGIFYANGSLLGNFYEPSSLITKVNFGIRKANVKYLKNGLEVKNLNLRGYFENGKRELLSLDNVSLVLNQKNIRGKFLLDNFSDPSVEVLVKGNISLGDILKFYPVDTIQSVDGSLFADLEIKGNVSKLKSNFTDESNFTRGGISADKVSVLFKSAKEIFLIESGRIDFNKNNVSLDSILLKTGKSDFLLSGQMENFLSWIFDNRSSLQISGRISSNFLNLDEFLSTDNSSKAGIAFPEQLQMDLILECKKAVLGKFTANAVFGKLRMKEKKIIGEEIKLNTLGGIIYVTGLLNGTNENELNARGSARLEKIDIREMFYAFNNFGQQTLAEDNIRGLASSTVDFSLSWDKQLKIIPEKIRVSSEILLEKGQLIAFKPLESLSKYVELSELQNIRFNNLESKIEIRDEEIFFSKTAIKNSAVNLEISGKQDFNSNIDFHLKMALSEVLAKKPGKNKEFDRELQNSEFDSDNRRCVFFHITGTYDKPIIAFDKKGMREKIKEDIKLEKQNLKQILNEEFGLFRKDTTLKKSKETVKDSKFEIDFGKDQKSKNPMKQEEPDDDDF